MKLQRATLVLSVLALIALPVQAHDGLTMVFASENTTAQEIPTPGPGLIKASKVIAKFDSGLTKVEVALFVEGGDNVFAAHFHCGRAGQTGPVAFGMFSPGPLMFDGQQAVGTLTNEDFSGGDCEPVIGRPVNNIAALAFAMKDGLIYANIHTSDNPPGEVRGQIQGLKFHRLFPIRDGDDDDDDDDDDARPTVHNSLSKQGVFLGDLKGPEKQ